MDREEVDTRRFDQVNTALQIALDPAGIEMPFPTQDLNVGIAPGQVVDEKISGSPVSNGKKALSR